MKRVLGIVLICLVAFSNSFAKVLETIDAVVNGEVILSGEVDARILLKARQLDKFVRNDNVMSLPTSVYQELRPQVLEQMIDELLLFQDIRGTLKENELTFLREDSLRKTDMTMEQFQKKFDTVDKLLQEESRKNMTWEEIRQATYQEIYNENIRKVIINQVINRRVDPPTQDELEEYQKNNSNNLPTGEISVQQILLTVPPDASAEDDHKILQKAQELVLRARGGDPFDYLIYVFSQHDASRKNNGLLPPFTKGTTRPEFDQLFDLNIGEISEPIRTPAGYHIMRVVFKDTLAARVLEVKKRIELNKRIEELRNKAKITRRESQGPSPIIPSMKPTNEVRQ